MLAPCLACAMGAWIAMARRRQLKESGRASAQVVDGVASGARRAASATAYIFFALRLCNLLALLVGTNLPFMDGVPTYYPPTDLPIEAK